MVAVTSRGRVMRIGEDGTSRDVTGAHVSGAYRPTFAKTENELAIAAGGPIVRLAGGETEILSQEAPETTHVVFLNGRLIAIEPGSQRWWYSEVGKYRSWPALNVLSAEQKPDNLQAAMVTPGSELLLAGETSVEQWEAIGDAQQPFTRRWTLPDGVMAPYTFTSRKEGVWGLNDNAEFVTFSARTAQPVSDPLQARLDEIDDWTDAWAEPVYVDGQKFILLQAPHATNAYGTQGVTFCYDMRKNRWSSLFGWEREAGRPGIWPGRSYLNIWDRHFVGGDGVIYELDTETYANGDQIQRMLGRTGHYHQQGHTMRIDNLRVQVKRGVVGPNAKRGPVFRLRFNRDNQGWTDWIPRDLGRVGTNHMVLEYGQLGLADTIAFEYAITDPAPVYLTKIEAKIQQVR
jgi:hypothetical protein